LTRGGDNAGVNSTVKLIGRFKIFPPDARHLCDPPILIDFHEPDDSCLPSQTGCFACRICRRQILANAQEMEVAQSLRIMEVYFRTPDGCSGWPRESKIGWRNSERYGQPDAPRESQRIDVL
jgi:hypothetical protein